MNQNKIIILLISLILILSIAFGIKIISGKNEESNMSDYNNNYVFNEKNEEEYKTDNKVSSETINTTDEELEEESKELLNKVIKHRNEVYEHNQKVEATAEIIVSVIVLVIVLVIGISMFIGLWKIFTREGIPGWVLFVPIYSLVQLCNVVGLTGWMVLLMFIPKVGGILFYLIINYNLATKYDKGLGYTLGLTFLPFIFYPLIAFKEN